MPSDDIEEWRPVTRAPEYEVSNWGRVRRKTPSRHSGSPTYAGYILKQPLFSSGYPSVGLMIDGLQQRQLVHRLVAEAFLNLPTTTLYYEVNHKDGVKTNNRVVNLEWTTPSENQEHAFATGLKAARPGPRPDLWGERNRTAKLTEADVRFIRGEGRDLPLRVLAARFHVTPENVASVRSGRTWKHIV